MREPMAPRASAPTRAARRSFLALAVLLAASIALADPSSALFRSTSERTDESVVVPGSAIPELQGRAVDDLGLFRVEPTTGRLEAIPFQIDERFDRVFNAGTPGEFTETVYDVFREDDGLLDAQDELVFRMGDAGEPAPLGGGWIAGAEPLRFEIAIADPLSGATSPVGWVYVFTGTALPRSNSRYLDWDGREDTSIVTDRFALDFEGNWLMTGLRVLPPCGDGADLIDRFKGRAEPLPGQLEDEEDWNGNSDYLGGYAGPVRAIRYVRGARSAVNTVHHDLIDKESWRRRMNLRVHALTAARLYFDWLPPASADLFASTLAGGVVVDGQPDSVPSTFPAWSLMRTAAGGLALVWRVPDSPLVGQKRFYYVDDATYDDKVPAKPLYADDDDSAYGVHGVELLNTLDSNLDPIVVGFDGLPLCGGVGDAGDGQAFLDRVANPLEYRVLPQADCEAVRTLGLRVQQPDVLLEWQAAAGAEEYRVFAADAPDTPRASWTLLGETAGLQFLDAGAALDGDRYYSVVCTLQDAEGPW